MTEHALLSASSSHRWLRCPPSARLEQRFENKTSESAEEGTLAHKLGELTLKLNLGEITTEKFNLEFKKIESNELFTADMPDYVGVYVDTCMEKVSEARAKTPDAIFKIEQRLDFSEWVPEGFGTGDFIIIADGTIEVCDLKYGKSPNGKVSAIGNNQMRLYALGAIAEFSFLYDIKRVKMTIIQPRLDSISTDEITVDELLKWAEEFVEPTAQLAFKGEGKFCGGKHCEYCRVATCEHRAEKNMEAAKYDFAVPGTLSKKDISDILGRVDELVKWVNNIKDYALEQALKGEELPGWKVVEGKSNRKYKDTEKVAEILMANDYPEDKIYKPKELQGFTNMEKIVGKKKLNELIGNFIEKPPGKPTLVVESDKRPEISSIDSAIQDFQEV